MEGETVGEQKDTDLDLHYQTAAGIFVAEIGI